MSNKFVKNGYKQLGNYLAELKPWFETGTMSRSDSQLNNKEQSTIVSPKRIKTFLKMKDKSVQIKTNNNIKRKRISRIN